MAVSPDSSASAAGTTRPGLAAAPNPTRHRRHTGTVTRTGNFDTNSDSVGWGRRLVWYHVNTGFLLAVYLRRRGSRSIGSTLARNKLELELVQLFIMKG